MNNYKHVMLDIETMGTGPNAAIVAIGAVRFNPNSNTIDDTFYRCVNLNSAVRAGGEIEANVKPEPRP